MQQAGYRIKVGSVTRYFMDRKEPKLTTIKALFAKSGNQCAFPTCDHPLVDDRNLFVAEVCHIHAVKKRDARYDPSLTDEQLRDYENLILLCPAHHKRIDSFEAEFSPDALKKMKAAHESRFAKPKFRVSNQIIAEATLQLIDPAWTPPLELVMAQLEEHLDAGVGMSLTSANMCFVRDAQLLLIYSDLIQNLPVVNRLRLYEEQKKWRENRHLKSEKSRKEFEGGTLAYLAFNSTFLDLTEKRIKVFQKRLHRYK